MNFARNKDPKIDAALQQGRSSTDPAVRKQAYATVQRQINTTSPTSGTTGRSGPWSRRTACAASPTVRCPTARGHPDGWRGRFRGCHVLDPDVVRVMIVGVAGRVLGGRAGDAASLPAHPKGALRPMRFVRKKVMQLVLVLLAVTFLSFLMLNLLPGRHGAGRVRHQLRPGRASTRRREELGLDKPDPGPLRQRGWATRSPATWAARRVNQQPVCRGHQAAAAGHARAADLLAVHRAGGGHPDGAHRRAASRRHLRPGHRPRSRSGCSRYRTSSWRSC